MNILKQSPEALKKAVEVLRGGGIVVHATETCYGIACDLTNPEAVKRMFEIKQRPEDQPVSALFSSIDAAEQYVEISPKARELACEYLPGPLTLVLPRKKHAPSLWLTVSGGGIDAQIGVRISSHVFASDLARAFGSPIATTSANLHGEPNPYAASDILTQWQGISPGPDLVIDAGRLNTCAPSTVVCVSGSSVTVLRQGGLFLDE